MKIPDRLPNPPRCEDVFCAPDTILVYKNGGFGYNPLNKESEKKIIEKIKAMSQLDNKMKTKESNKK